MANATENKPITKADARALIRKEAAFFLGKKTPEEKRLLRTANNVSFVIQEHHGEEGITDIHRDIFGGLNKLKQEYITKAGEYLTTCLAKYEALHKVTNSHMAASDIKWKEKMSQTPCKFFKLGICKNGFKCPYAHNKGNTKKKQWKVDTTPKIFNLDPPKTKNQITISDYIAPMQKQIAELLQSVGKLTKRGADTAAVTNFLKEDYCRKVNAGNFEITTKQYPDDKSGSLFSERQR